MLEFQTAQHRETYIEAGVSGVFPLKEEESTKEYSLNEMQNGTSQSALGSVETVSELEQIFDNRKANTENRKAQLETIAGIQLKKELDDEFYNTLIDQCNDGDEKIAKFFKLVANNDIENVKRELSVNPMIALEVNGRMETVLHLAVSLGLFEMCEYLLE